MGFTSPTLQNPIIPLHLFSAFLLFRRWKENNEA